MTLRFIIPGNHLDPNGNPVPFTRTLNYAWRAQSTRYREWANYVRGCYLSALRKEGLWSKAWTAGGLKPIKLGKEEYMRVKCYIEWKNEAHGDGDNIMKGILDSLLLEDKNVTEGYYKCKNSKDGKGRVDVELTIV